MADTHLILHIKGTDSQTAALLREEVRSAVWQGRITQSQLIWRPTENAWKPVKDLPELIPPLEHLILHVKGTEAETRQLPRPAVRQGISKGEITHSQLIWRPTENMWKQVREIPDLLPSQKLAPAPEPVRVRATPVAVPVEEMIPESPAGPVARAVAAGGAPPRVKMPGAATRQVHVAMPVAVPVAVPHVRAVAVPETVPRVRVAVVPEEAPEPQAVAVPRVRVAVAPEETPEPQAVAVPRVRIAAPPEETPEPQAVAVPRVRVAVAPEEALQPRVAVMPEVVVPQVRAVATPDFVPPVRAVVAPQPVPQIRAVPMQEAIAQPEAVETPAPAPLVRAVVASMVPRARAVPEPEAVHQVEAVELPVAIPQVRAMAVPAVPQPRVMSMAVPQVRAVEAPAEVPQVRSVAMPVVMPQVQVRAVAEEPAEEKISPESIAPAGLIAQASMKSRRVKEEATSHPLKSLCIGLGLIIIFMIGANYLFVDRPLASRVKASEFSGVSVYGHLAAFIQPNVIVIHVPSNKEIIEENFTKFLVALAHATPANPITTLSFSRVALTSGWTAQYSFSGQDWKQLSELGDETETSRKEFIMAHLDDAGGDPVMTQTTLHDEGKADKREEIWLRFVDTFAVKPPR